MSKSARARRIGAEPTLPGPYSLTTGREVAIWGLWHTYPDPWGLWHTTPAGRPRSFGGCGTRAPIGGGCGTRTPRETRDRLGIVLFRAVGGQQAAAPWLWVAAAVLGTLL